MRSTLELGTVLADKMTAVVLVACRCEGSLNPVDSAGSKRLNVSFSNGAKKERVKRMQAIDKSLSVLDNIIAALGER